MLEKEEAARISIAEIEDHPWMQRNIETVKMIDPTNLKEYSSFVSSLSNLRSLLIDGKYFGIPLSEYDPEDLIRVNKILKRNFVTKNLSFQDKAKNNIVHHEKHEANIHFRSPRIVTKAPNRL